MPFSPTYPRLEVNDARVVLQKQVIYGVGPPSELLISQAAAVWQALPLAGAPSGLSMSHAADLQHGTSHGVSQETASQLQTP